MAENCKLVEAELDMNTVVPALLAYKEQFRGIPGKECLGHSVLYNVVSHFASPSLQIFYSMVTATCQFA